MNDLVKNKFNLMTILEVSKMLNTTTRTVNRYAKDLFPEIFKNGVATTLNEKQVTAIKLNFEKSDYLDNPVKLPKTNLEKKLLIQQAMNLLNEEVEELKAEVEAKNQRLIEAQPKIDFHNQVGDSEGLYSIGEVAKMLNLDYGRNTMFKTLRELDVFFDREPYQKYIKQGYFEVKSTTKNGHVQKQSFATAKGFQWLQKKHFSKPYQTEF